MDPFAHLVNGGFDAADPFAHLQQEREQSPADPFAHLLPKPGSGALAGADAGAGAQPVLAPPEPQELGPPVPYSTLLPYWRQREAPLGQQAQSVAERLRNVASGAGAMGYNALQEAADQASAAGASWDTLTNLFSAGSRAAAPLMGWLASNLPAAQPQQPMPFYASDFAGAPAAPDRFNPDFAGPDQQQEDLATRMIREAQAARAKLPAPAPKIRTQSEAARQAVQEQFSAPGAQQGLNTGFPLWKLGPLFDPNQETTAETLIKEGVNPIYAMALDLLMPGGPAEMLGESSRVLGPMMKRSAAGWNEIARTKGGALGRALAGTELGLPNINFGDLVDQAAPALRDLAPNPAREAAAAQEIALRSEFRQAARDAQRQAYLSGQRAQASDTTSGGLARLGQAEDQALLQQDRARLLEELRGQQPEDPLAAWLNQQSQLKTAEELRQLRRDPLSGRPVFADDPGAVEAAARQRSARDALLQEQTDARLQRLAQGQEGALQSATAQEPFRPSGLEVPQAALDQRASALEQRQAQLARMVEQLQSDAQGYTHLPLTVEQRARVAEPLLAEQRANQAWLDEWRRAQVEQPQIELPPERGPRREGPGVGFRNDGPVRTEQPSELAANAEQLAANADELAANPPTVGTPLRTAEDIANERRRPPITRPIDPRSVGVDAKAYQFKAGGDSAGVTDRLRGVGEWDNSLSGTAIVHERADGSRWIADGHQRLGLAKRLMAEGQDPWLNAHIYRERDGWSIQDVRIVAARKNIAEGTGTALDAAKIFKADPNALRNLPTSSSLVRDGRELAKLGDQAFEEVVNGAVPESYAAHVGRLLEDPADQLAAIKALKRVEPANSAQAESIVRDIRAQGLATKSEQGGLFGPEAWKEDLLGERARIFDEAQKQVSGDKALFSRIVTGANPLERAGNKLAREANVAEVDRAGRILSALEEAKYVGPVNAKLNELAVQLKSGDITKADAARQFLSTVEQESKIGRLGGRGRGALGPVRPGADAAAGAREAGAAGRGAERADGAHPQGESPDAVEPEVKYGDELFSAEVPGRRRRGQPGPGSGSDAVSPGQDLTSTVVRPEPPERPKPPEPYTVGGEKVHLGGMEVTRRVPMPGLVRLVRELTGQVPNISEGLQKLGKKLGGTVHGSFSPKSGRLSLNPDIFRDPDLASQVFAHEIGHLVDWFPDRDMQRGNLIGRVASLRGFMESNLGGLKNADLKRELLALSEWWRPYDKSKAPLSFRKYRESSAELYADAISVLLNDADELQRRAPLFAQQFFAHLDAKPDVAKALVDVHDWMSGTLADVVTDLRRDVRGDFVRGEDLWKGMRVEAEAREGNFAERLRQQYDSLRYEFSDRGGELKRRAGALAKAGEHIDVDLDPRTQFDAGNFLQNRNYMLAQRWGDEVVRPLREAKIDDTHLGELMLFQRIVDGDRAGLANPHGITTVEAGKALEQLQQMPEYATLKKAADAARERVWQITEAAAKEGLLDDAMLQALEGNKDNYAAFAVLDFLQDRMPATIKQQSGTFRAVANPATAMLMKGVATNNWINWNRSKRLAVEFMERYFPDEMERALSVGPGAFAPAPRGKSLLEVYRDGKRIGYHVDPWVSEIFDRAPHGHLEKLANGLTALDNTIFRPLWIAYSGSFMVQNPIRDFDRTARNLGALGITSKLDPGVGLVDAYGKAWKEARTFAKGGRSALIDQMIEDMAIAPPGEMVTDQLVNGTQTESILHRYNGLLKFGEGNEAGWRGWPAVRGVKSLLEKWSELGRTLEALPKVAAFQLLGEQGIMGAERAHLVRTYVGTPNYKIKGAATGISNRALIFSNIALQGWKADLELATRPTTRAGFWMQTMLRSVAPKMLMAGAAAGLLGPELKEMFSAISEYDKSKFICLPVGWEEGGEKGKRLRFMRIPMDETSRFFGGLAWKMANGPNSGKDLEDWLSDVALFAGGSFVPDMGPTAKSLSNLAQVAQGQNPVDDFYGRPIIDKTAFEAGGADRWKGLMKWQIEQLGEPGRLLRTYVFHDGGTRPIVSWIPAKIPGASAIFRVSDRGFTEREYQDKANTDKQKAKFKMGLGSATQSVFHQVARLRMIGKNRSPQQDSAYFEAVAFDGRYRAKKHLLDNLRANGHTADAEQVGAELEADAQQVQEKIGKLLGRQ